MHHSSCQSGNKSSEGLKPKSFRPKRRHSFFALLLAAVLFVGLLPTVSLPITAASPAADFEFDESIGMITKYTGSATNVVIPETINGVTVTAIGMEAFAGCSWLTGVSIPEKHICNRGKFVYFWSEHPHYSCYECSVCGKVWYDTTSKPTKLESCEKCYPPETKNTSYFNESYNADGTITIEVGIQTVGVVSIGGLVAFDSDVLELLSVEGLEDFTTFRGPQSIQLAMETGEIPFSADSSPTWVTLRGKLRLFTAVFRPKKQTTTTFRGTVNSACDKDLNDISFTVNEKTISTVGTPTASFVWGDADGNGKVETKDKVLVSRYLAKWTMNGGFNQAAADFNKDGDVTSAEAVVLARYLAKWINLPYPVGKKAV